MGLFTQEFETFYNENNNNKKKKQHLIPETLPSAVSTTHRSPPEKAAFNIYFVTRIFTPPLYQVY